MSLLNLGIILNMHESRVAAGKQECRLKGLNFTIFFSDFLKERISELWVLCHAWKKVP